MSAKIEYALHRFALSWVNSLLCPKWQKALSLHSDFLNGCRLVALAEVITKPATTPLPGTILVPGSLDDFATNTRIAVSKFEEFYNVSLVSAQPERISNGDTALLLDLLLFIATKHDPDHQFVRCAHDNGITFTTFTVLPHLATTKQQQQQIQQDFFADSPLTYAASTSASARKEIYSPTTPPTEQQHHHHHHHKHYSKESKSNSTSNANDTGSGGSGSGGGGGSSGTMAEPMRLALGQINPNSLPSLSPLQQQMQQQGENSPNSIHQPYWLVPRVRSRHSSSGASTSTPPATTTTSSTSNLNPNSVVSPGITSPRSIPSTPSSEPTSPGAIRRKHRDPSPYVHAQNEQQFEPHSPSSNPDSPNPRSRLPHVTNVALLAAQQQQQQVQNQLLQGQRPRHDSGDGNSLSPGRTSRSNSATSTTNTAVSPRRMKASKDACRKGFTCDNLPQWFKDDLVRATEIDLSCNHLDSVPEIIFESPSACQEKLVHLSLDCNGITSLPTKLLPTLRFLKVLCINVNPLGELPAAIFTLPSLQRLSCFHCALTSISFPQSNPSPLEELELDDNQLTTIPEGISVLSNTLQLLSVSGNHLESLPFCIGRMQRFTDLFAADNRLVQLPVSLASARRLTRLDVSDNRISELPKQWFIDDNNNGGNNAPTITDLEIQRNKITELPPNFFTALSSIEFLDISDNQLSKLPESIVNAQRLEALYAGGNKITEIPQALAQLEGLSTLDISRNIIRMLPDFTPQSKLQILVAGFNPLRISPLTLPQCLTKLHLSCCGLRDFPTLRLPKLIELFAAGNRFEEAELSGIVQSHLKIVDLSYNKLKTQPAALTVISSANNVEIKLGNNLFEVLTGRSNVVNNLQAFEPRLCVGISEMQGRREKMEDAVCAMGDLLGDKTTDLIVMLDGHGCGGALAYSAAVRIAKNLSENLRRGNERECIVEALHSADELFHSQQQQGKPQGSTALIGLFTSNAAKLHLANLGDTRAVLSHCGSPLQLSVDHCPLDDEEHARIVAAGGYVAVDSNPAGAVMGEVGITRALGDNLLRPYITNEPHYAEFEIVDGDEFLIFACDGVWDVITPENAVKTVREALSSGAPPGIAALALRDLAYNSESGDNITVAVISLNAFGQQQQQQQSILLGSSNSSMNLGSSVRKPINEAQQLLRNQTIRKSAMKLTRGHHH